MTIDISDESLLDVIVSDPCVRKRARHGFPHEIGVLCVPRSGFVELKKQTTNLFEVDEKDMRHVQVSSLN